MTREKATKIVKDFLSDMNPDMWDGNGNKPESFNERAWQYPLTDSVNLEITFVNDEVDGWLLKDFYDLIESLVNKIGHYKPDEFGKYMCEESIGGNYSGTNFKILITE